MNNDFIARVQIRDMRPGDRLPTFGHTGTITHITLIDAAADLWRITWDWPTACTFAPVWDDMPGYQQRPVLLPRPDSDDDWQGTTEPDWALLDALAAMESEVP